MTATKIEDLPTVYDPKETEDSIYKFWEEGEFFKADAKSQKPPYSIVIPPPNVTGVLHMGHALDETLQDILTRYHRMAGYETLWLPGTDHAGIATQNVVEKMLREKGLSRYDLGREKFLEETWKWANEHKSAILDQCKRLGASFDRSRERFTFDKGCSDAVKEVFVRLYEKGLIYKGKYIVNWCPRCNSAISDVETEYATEQGHMWEISYPLKGESGAIIVATTRPETIFGDVAIAVHPSDHKYSELIGKTVIIPLSGREIPIIADEYVDKNFGTGAVKITPAHDPNDFEVGKRHGLAPIWVINNDGTMKACGQVPQELHGLDRYEAREKIIGMLSYNNFLLRTRDHEHNVGKCQRCGTTIEPLLSEQWFVKMEPLAKEAIAAVKDGRIKFVPDRWEKNYLGWMENIRDWCISRQLWWGHQIPAYYHNETGEMVVAKENPDPENYTQDSDVLDTWFSSGLWPFSTMGWPNTESEDFKKFYPTTTLVTGFDIITFWVSRMMTQALEFTGEVPFKDVLIHGIVRDSQGRKMSKTLGNGVDPLDVIEKYGADSLRFSVLSGTTMGNDIRFMPEKLEQASNFANKIWNAAKFIINANENVKEEDVKEYCHRIYDDKTKTYHAECCKIEDKWMMNKVDKLVAEVTKNIENYDLGIALDKIYSFIWNEFCDWYIEMVKPRLYGEDYTSKVIAVDILNHALETALKLLHPFMPFVTTEVFSNLIQYGKHDLMVADWPNVRSKFAFDEEEQTVEKIKEIITEIRNVRANMNIHPSKKSELIFVTQKYENEIWEAKDFILKLGLGEKIIVQKDKAGILENAISILKDGIELYMPLEDLVDMEEERKRLEEEKTRLESEVARCEKMLSNPGFVNKAPEKKIQEEKDKLEKYKEMLAKVEQRLK